MTQEITHTEDPSAAIREWQAVLTSLKQENVVLKGRLSQVLQQEVSKAFLEKAEYYHQRFLFKDQLMELLRHDITDLWQEIKMSSLHPKQQGWQTRFAALEKDMDKLETEFNSMKAAFEQSLLH